jgi:hypothetical protein
MGGKKSKPSLPHEVSPIIIGLHHCLCAAQTYFELGLGPRRLMIRPMLLKSAD